MNTRIELIKPVPSNENIHIFSILGMEAGIVKNMSLFSSSIRSVMQKYLEERHEITFDKIFNQRIERATMISFIQVKQKLVWKVWIFMNHCLSQSDHL